MSKIRISKRYHPARKQLEPLPLDPRDRDIMHAKHLARLARAVRHHRTRSRRSA